MIGQHAKIVVEVFLSCRSKVTSECHPVLSGNIVSNTTTPSQAHMTTASSNDDEWKRIAGTTQALIRSRIEIARFLAELADTQTPLSGSVANAEGLFATRLRYIAPGHEYILLDCSTNDAANSELLAAASVTFTGRHEWASIQFLAKHPSEEIFDNTRVMRFDFPPLLVIQQQRIHKRIEAVPEVPLRGIANVACGTLSFDCKVVDISRGGLGTVIYGNDIVLEPGTVLTGCQIIHPRGTVVIVNIEIRHCTQITLPDGTVAQRAGCSFIGEPSGIEDLLKVFILNLESAD